MHAMQENPVQRETCLSWTGSWKIGDGMGRTPEMTQTRTPVSGTDDYHQELVSGSTCRNPPGLTGNVTWPKSGVTFPFTFAMAPEGKSFFGGLPGKNILTVTW
jgi:hypothetical protein